MSLKEMFNCSEFDDEDEFQKPDDESEFEYS